MTFSPKVLYSFSLSTSSTVFGPRSRLCVPTTVGKMGGGNLPFPDAWTGTDETMNCSLRAMINLMRV